MGTPPNAVTPACNVHLFIQSFIEARVEGTCNGGLSKSCDSSLQHSSTASHMYTFIHIHTHVHIHIYIHFIGNEMTQVFLRGQVHTHALSFKRNVYAFQQTLKAGQRKTKSSLL